MADTDDLPGFDARLLCDDILGKLAFVRRRAEPVDEDMLGALHDIDKAAEWLADLLAEREPNDHMACYCSCGSFTVTDAQVHPF